VKTEKNKHMLPRINLFVYRYPSRFTGALIYSAAQLHECLINLLTFLLTYSE